MKTAIRIARLELSTLFYSHIAWFLLIVFLFQRGLSYTEKIDNYLTLQQLGSPKDLLIYATNTIFGLPGGLPNGVLSEIISRLYLYLPLLTMGLMSREISSGTIKLLYSSPVKINQIIFGKFLSMIVYNFLLILILGVFVIMGCFHIAHADVGQLFSGLLGIYLLLCAYAAIGLFMSCLTSYQVVAALSTFVLFALLSYIGSLWQNIDYARDVTYALSISGRTTHMIAGLISSKDVIYFLVVIYIFLGLSMLRLQSERQSRPILSHILRYSLLIGSAVLISYGSSRPGLIAYYDATANKTETLTPNTQQIIKEIGNSPLEVISYINILDQRFFYGLPSRRNLDQDRWEPYLRFKPDIRFKYVYYYDSIPDPEIYKRNSGKTLKQIAQDYAQMHKVDFRDFKGPEEVGKMADLKPEQNRYVMQLRFKGKSTFLRLFDDQRAFPSEAETSAALKRMTSKLPKIVFLQGEQERSANKFDTGSYKTLTSDITFRYAL
ncbi:MAG TPA: Gldg family protein, partial [Pedobacter sp.]